jgi:hypothetical protein
MHSVQSPSSQSRHQTSDGLEIWRLSHIPQKDGEADMMLISCNILLILEYKSANIRKSSIYTVKNMSVRVVEFVT